MVRDLRRPPRQFSALTAAVIRCVPWVLSRLWPGRLAYRRYLRRGGLEVVRTDVPVPGLPAALDGLRIVQLSDLHGGDFLDEESLQPMVQLAQAGQPQILALTGDFITSRSSDVHALGLAVARIDAPLGKFAVFGNHDYRGRQEGNIAAALRRQGVTVLRNSSVLLRTGGCTLRVAGLEDIEESRLADLDAALEGSDGGEDVRILLCHNPDVVDALDGERFDLVLSGHSHGGQINIPWLGSLGEYWMPRRRRGSHRLPGGGLLHVNRGVGVLVLPIRLGARAEVTYLTLRRAADATATDRL